MQIEMRPCMDAWPSMQWMPGRKKKNKQMQITEAIAICICLGFFFVCPLNLIMQHKTPFF